MATGDIKAISHRLSRLTAAAAVLAGVLAGTPATATDAMPVPELRVDPPVIATIPPAGAVGISGGPVLRILFPAGDDTVSAAYADLLARLAQRLESPDGGRVRIRAYAPTSGDDRAARRLSLNRALAVRERLIESGLGAARIDLLALGGLTVAGPADRVDVGLTP